MSDVQIETIVKIEVKQEDGFCSDIESESPGFEVKLEEDIIVKKEEYLETNHSQCYQEEIVKKTSRKSIKAKAKPLPGIKNVVKNYGKAMCSFAYSDLSEPYITPMIKKERITREGFNEWVQNNKERVDGIVRLRWLLLANPQDEPVVKSYKRVFQKISEIFLKYFCVNWIFSGKLTHRGTHLSLMHKMLRRVKNPELFTYLHNISNKKAS